MQLDPSFQLNMWKSSLDSVKRHLNLNYELDWLLAVTAFHTDLLKKCFGEFIFQIQKNLRIIIMWPAYIKLQALFGTLLPSLFVYKVQPVLATTF